MSIEINSEENVTDILSLEISQRHKKYRQLSDEFNELLEKRDYHEKCISEATRKINKLREELNHLDHLIWHGK